MAITTATIAQWLSFSPSADEEEMLGRVLAVAESWAFDQIRDDAHEEVKVQEAILLYAVRRYQSKDAPTGAIETDGFQSQGFVSYKDLEDLLAPFRIWAVG